MLLVANSSEFSPFEGSMVYTFLILLKDYIKVADMVFKHSVCFLIKDNIQFLSGVAYFFTIDKQRQ